MTDIASGLKAIGVPVKGRVGVFGANSPEWMITMQVRPARQPLTSRHAAFAGILPMQPTLSGCRWSMLVATLLCTSLQLPCGLATGSQLHSSATEV